MHYLSALRTVWTVSVPASLQQNPEVSLTSYSIRVGDIVRLDDAKGQCLEDSIAVTDLYSMEELWEDVKSM